MPYLNKPVAAICLAVASAFVQAQEATYDFNIQPQSVSQVLDALVKQTGLQPFFVVETVKGKPSPGVQGKMNLREAVAKALAGSGLSYQFTGDKAVGITLLQAGEAVVADKTTVLSPVTITAKRAESARFMEQFVRVDTTQQHRTSDTAAMLDGQPGVSMYFGGGVSSLPAINGLADDRLRVLVDGMEITSSCPNHMNPALSYMDPTVVESVRVVAGTVPVSLGGDSIGGTIVARSADPTFALAGQQLKEGSISGFYRSNGDVTGGNIRARVANETFSASYAGSTVTANNYKDGNGRPQAATEYAARNHLLGLAMRSSGHLVSLDIGWQDIPYQGYANQFMDMTENTAQSFNLRYKGNFDWGRLDGRVYKHDVTHKMNMLDDKKSLGWDMPMNAEGKDIGYALQAELPMGKQDTVRIGHEYHHYNLNDWWPPIPGAAGIMGPNTFWNINDGKRDRVAVFGEWDRQWTPAWMTQFGIRHERVTMDTGNVQGYYSTGDLMGMVPNGTIYQNDATAFNAASHKKTDNNLDWTALARYVASTKENYEFGLARKTRSPNLHERFAWSNEAWMAGAMNNWFGDLNAYVGNVNLKPEVAHSLRATADWHDAEGKDWQFKATPFLTRVDDYITVERNTATTYMAPPGRVALRFVNHEAALYGIDLSGKKYLGRAGGEWVARAVVNYVRGKDQTTGGNLYNIMPPNLRLAVDHSRGAWSNTLELLSVAAKTKTDETRLESATKAYTLFNIRTAYTIGNLRLDAGVDNLFDKQYDLPLGGLDAYAYRYRAANLASVRGSGRSINFGVNYKF